MAAVSTSPPPLSEPGLTVEVTEWKPLEPEDIPAFTDLLSVDLVRHDPEYELTERTLAAVAKMSVDLDLGETIENQVIVLNPHPKDSREFRVEQQFETSMAIGDEGPHFDLTDWKHYTSKWEEIQKLEENKFLTAGISESDSTRFPYVSTETIRKAVASRSDSRWLKLAGKCATPNSGPCYVSVSRISFRVSARENDGWKPIHRIDFSMPMGC